MKKAVLKRAWVTKTGTNRWWRNEKLRAFDQILHGMTARQDRTWWLVKAGEHEHGASGQDGRQREGNPCPAPSHQRPCQCRPAGVSNRAGKFDSPICRPKCRRRHKSGHKRRRGHAVDNRAASAQKAEYRQGRPRHQIECEQDQDRDKGHHAQRFRPSHQTPARHSVGENAGGNRQKQERQGRRGLQQAGCARTRTESEHGDDGYGGKRDLFGRLGGKVRPGQLVESRRQSVLGLRGHGGVLRCGAPINAGRSIRQPPVPCSQA